MATYQPDGTPSPDTNNRSGSTRWEWRQVRISPAPNGPANRAAAGDHSGRLSDRNPREPLTMTVKLRGGPECWVEIQTRGRTIRYPGHWSVYDVLRALNGKL